MSAKELDDLVFNFVRFYILTILYEGSIHGYGILRKFKNRVGKKISPGLVYPFLQKLEERGLLTYTTEAVGEKERKQYSLTEEGRKLCNRLFNRFANIVSTAIEPSLDICVHCGCKVYEGGYMEIVNGVKMTFCCVHCAQSYKQDQGISRGTPTSKIEDIGGEKQMVRDPICGMEVDKKTAKFKAEHIGKTYYFCSTMCKERFETDPYKYLKK